MNTDDINFAYKVRHALNEHLDTLPATTTDRLAQARQLALARKKPQAEALAVRHSRLAGVLAGAGGNAGNHGSGHFGNGFGWLGRLGVALPMLLLVGGLVGVYHLEEQQRIADLAEVDAAVLADELPPTAYLDHGFNAYLAQSEQ